jgi:hypothetical protein
MDPSFYRTTQAANWMIMLFLTDFALGAVTSDRSLTATLCACLNSGLDSR